MSSWNSGTHALDGNLVTFVDDVKVGDCLIRMYRDGRLGGQFRIYKVTAVETDRFQSDGTAWFSKDRAFTERWMFLRPYETEKEESAE